MNAKLVLPAALWLGCVIPGTAQIGLTLVECEERIGPAAPLCTHGFPGKGKIADYSVRDFEKDAFNIKIYFRNRGLANKAVYCLPPELRNTPDGDFTECQVAKVLCLSGINPHDMKLVPWRNPSLRTHIECWVSSDENTVLVYSRTRLRLERKVDPRIEIYDAETFLKEYRR